MSAEQLVFDHVFEGLLKAVGQRVTPALKARFKALGVDLDGKLKAYYPVEAWNGCVEACRAELYPSVPRDKALFQLGTEMVAGFGSTVLGKVQLQMMKLLGPKRTLQRMPAAHRAGNNFTEAKLTEKGPRELELWMNPVGEAAPFVAGSLVESLRLAGAKEPKVDVVPGKAPEATFVIRWSE